MSRIGVQSRFVHSAAQASLLAIVSTSVIIAAFWASVTPGGREHAAPVEEFDIDALLLQRRRVDALLALVGRDGERAQLARLDLLGELAVAGDARRHLAAEQRRQRRAAAGERRHS